jgi:hypothetical protein
VGRLSRFSTDCADSADRTTTLLLDDNDKSFRLSAVIREIRGKAVLLFRGLHGFSG